MITDEELYILSYYRAGELAGSLLLGRIALHTTIDSIRAPLTRHCMEEAEHAWLWTETIQQLGYTPLPVTRTYQSEYGRAFGMPKNVLEVLCLTQILERRVLSHFKKHLSRPGTHPSVKRSLERMINDEEGHLGWVWEALQRFGGEHGADVVEHTMHELERVDQSVFGKMGQESPFKEYFA